MSVRRSFTVTAALALLAVPVLSSCGFDYNTDRVNTNTAGTIAQEGPVDVVAATVVASGPDEGTFIANLSNNNRAEDAVFEALEGDEGVTATAFEEITIAPGGYVNLADGAGVKITGTFEAGDIISLRLGFTGGETVTLGVPVVRACGDYEGLDPVAETTTAPSPSASPTDPAATAAPTDEPTIEASEPPDTEGSSAPGEPSEEIDRYSCELVSESPE